MKKRPILTIRAFEINNVNNKLEKKINVTQQKELERSDNHKIIRDFQGITPGKNDPDNEYSCCCF